MSVRVSPWKNTGKFMAVVRFRWPDRSVLRDRTVVDAKTEAAARRWGEQRERKLLAKGQQKLEDEKASNEPPCLSVTTWYGKYHEAAERSEVGRKNRGKPQTAVRDRRDRFKNWIEPEIGHLPMNRVTIEHLRAIVAKLDDQVRLRMRFYEGAVEREERLGKMRKAGLSAKSAAHIWSEVTSGFREALSSKLDHLRVLRVDPTFGVQPPISTDSREQEALYPSEVRQLLSCEEIPLPRRRCYAVAIYTAMRRSELERLEAAHVDFEHGVITVQGTKSNAARRQVPIEPALLPLLKKL
ncbi:MAG: tyrosine-type recombinase/integrase, partial [Labilithrix sp.]|nr:tyrosine-type recombinase/integrase [Labilithrix sp.]